MPGTELPGSHHPFSSLFIGKWSVTVRSGELQGAKVGFQFPLQWEVVCN